MFGNHVTKFLSAYAHGELSAGETERVNVHLQACAGCREEFEEIKLGIRLAECLPSASAPDSLWDGIESGLIRDSAHAKSTRHASLPPRSRFNLSPRWRQFATAGAVACLLLVGLAGWLYVRSTRPAWEVERLAGSPSLMPTACATGACASASGLRPTDNHALIRAQHR